MADNEAACERLRDFIVKRRLALGRSQPEVARIGGFPRGSLGTFEAGRNTLPKRELLRGIAKGIGVPLSALEAVINDQPLPTLPTAEHLSLAERIICLKPEDQFFIEQMIARFEQINKQ